MTILLSKEDSETVIALAASHRFNKPVRPDSVTIADKYGVVTNYITVDGVTDSFGQKEAVAMVNGWLDTLGSKNSVCAFQNSDPNQFGKIDVYGDTKPIEKKIFKKIRENEVRKSYGKVPAPVCAS
jgi:hypothetical protein